MKETIGQKIGNSLKTIRNEHKYNLEDLSLKSGVSSSTLSRYEAGIGKMKIDTLEKILNSYDISLDIFFNKIVAKTQ